MASKTIGSSSELKHSCFFSLKLWETKKVHTTSAVCLKRDSDVVFNDGEVVVSAADNCNRLQVTELYIKIMKQLVFK